MSRRPNRRRAPQVLTAEIERLESRQLLAHEYTISASPSEVYQPPAGQPSVYVTVTVDDTDSGGSASVQITRSPWFGKVYKESVSPANEITPITTTSYPTPYKLLIEVPSASATLGLTTDTQAKVQLSIGTGYTGTAPYTIITLHPTSMASTPANPTMPRDVANDRGAPVCPVARKPSPMSNTPAPGISVSPSVAGKSGVNVQDGSKTVDPVTLFSEGFGKTWALASDWSSVFAFSEDSTLGRGVVNIFQPSIKATTPDQFRVVASATQVRYYTDSRGMERATAYSTQPEILRTNVPTAGNKTQFEQVDEYGNVLRFYDFDSGIPYPQRGKFKEYEDAYGNKVTANYDSSGTLTSETRTDGTTTETFKFTYIPSNLVNAGLMSDAELYRTAGGVTTPVRKAHFVYYDGSASPVTGQKTGNVGDLKFEQVLDPSGAVIDTTYYRYYTSATDNFVDGLAYLFHPDAYDRLVQNLKPSTATSFDPADLTDDQVKRYADGNYEYDSLHRVTKAVVQGEGCSCANTNGSGAYTYVYETAPANIANDFNNWRSKTIETLPDDNKEYYYFNFAGQLILDALVETGTGKIWATSYRYDARGSLVQTALPSAVSITSLAAAEAYPDLVGLASGSYQFIRDYSGLIQVAVYGQGTTATETIPGDAKGYLSANKVQQGYKNPAITTDSYQYYRHVDQRSVKATTYPIARTTLYANEDNTAARATNYIYGWYTNPDGPWVTSRIQSVQVVLPSISAAQNGPGTATSPNSDTTMTVYDAYGRPVWFRDGDNFIHYTAYDNATGAVVKTIVDVDMTRTSDFINPPQGWTTRAGGGLHLATVDQVDVLGRTVRETDAKGAVTFWIYKDVDHEVRTYRGWDVATGTTAIPIEVVRRNRGYGYVDTLTMAPASVTPGSLTPTGDESIGTIFTLTRDQLDLGQRVIETETYYNLANLTYPGTSSQSPPTRLQQLSALGVYWMSLGVVGTNYYTTDYGYDKRGRLSRVVNGVGTINRVTYDAPGRVVDASVGTDDSMSSSNNMTQVAAYEYDGGGVGDGNLTRATTYPGGGAAERVTQFVYDYRDRLRATKAGVQTGESADTQRQIVVLNLDNLGEVTAVSRYDGDTINLTTELINTPASLATLSPLLRAYSETQYDDQGRPFLQGLFSVSIDSNNNGTKSANAVTSRSFYDHRGDLVAYAAPGGLVAKYQFDGAGRLIDVAQTDGAAGLNWAAAGSLAGDRVFTETRTRYDGVGNPIQVTTLDRRHDDPSTGPLLGSDAATIPEVWLSDLPTATFHESKGYDGTVAAERDHSVGGAADHDGGTLTIGNTTYAKGLGVHANSDISIDVGGIYSRFQSYVGIDAESGNNGSVVFYVFANKINVPLSDTSQEWDVLATVTAHGGEAAKFIDVDITGRDKLRLAVSNGGDGFDYDHADWAGAKLTVASTVYLSDKAYSATEVKGYYNYAAAERDHSVGNLGDHDGGVLTVGGTAYAKGLGVHADSELRFALNGLYSRFRAVVGIDAESGNNGSVVFKVYADENVLLKTIVVDANTGRVPVAIDVDVSGRNSLRLSVSNDNDGFDYDHADWADARLTVAPARTSYTAAYYDAVDRLVAAVDVGTNGGSAYARPSTPPARTDAALVTSYHYNSSGWVDQVTDPRGLRTRYAYDALGRVTEVVSNASVNAPSPNGDVSSFADNKTRYTYDGIDHVLTATAVLPTGTNSSNGQTTTYVYGVTKGSGSGSSAVTSNDLLAAVIQPNETTGAAPDGNPATLPKSDPNNPESHRSTYRYNALGQVVGMTDANGTTHAYTYDVLGRFLSDSIAAFGTGVDATINRLETAYDTAGRAYRFTSYRTGDNGIANQVLRTFNGFGQLLTEAQEHGGAVTGSSPKTQYAYTEMVGPGNIFQNNSRLVSMTYPNGRVINYSYDGIDAAISRPTSVTETIGVTAVLESYKYLGLGTVVERAQPQAGVKLTYIRQAGDASANTDGGDIYTGLDRFGRIIDQNWVRTAASSGDGGGAAGSSTVRLQYAYDRDGNATSRRDLVNTALSELYAYDGLNRLTSMKRGILSAQTPGGPLDTISTPNRQQAWNLDSQGNWIGLANDGGNSVSRDFNAANQATTVGYSATGNTLSKNGTSFTYDAWNRLTSAGTSAYRYDALGRRITETVGATATDVYFTPDWQAIEERSKVNGVAQNAATQYVLGVTGQVVLRDTTTLTNSINGSERRFAQQNANGDTMATIFLAAVQERYRYDAYGSVTVTSSDGSPRMPGQRSLFRALFQGGRYDYNTEMYLFQHRDLDPADGTWMERDPLGLAAGDMNVRRFVNNNPTNRVDLTGLSDIWEKGRQTGTTTTPVPIQTGGPSDVPDSLPGRWSVGVYADDGHAWIRYQCVSDPSGKFQTGDVHTVGKYAQGYGGTPDPNNAGQYLVPPASIPGVQWDIDKKREPGLANDLKAGRVSARQVILDNPKIYKGPNGGRGYSVGYNNCTTHAAWAWFTYTGEWLDQRPGPFTNPLPDLPWVLKSSIDQANSPIRLPNGEMYFPNGETY